MCQTEGGKFYSGHFKNEFLIFSWSPYPGLPLLQKPPGILQAISVSKTPSKTPPTDNVTKRDLNIPRDGKKKP